MESARCRALEGAGTSREGRSGLTESESTATARLEGRRQACIVRCNASNAGASLVSCADCHGFEGAAHCAPLAEATSAAVGRPEPFNHPVPPMMDRSIQALVIEH